MIPMRQSTATDQNTLLVDDLSAPVALTKKGTPKGSPRGNVAWLRRARRDHGIGEVGDVVLIGGKSVVDFRIRVAQSHARHDLTPSYWSTVGVLASATRMITVPVGSTGVDLSLIPATNAMTPAPAVRLRRREPLPEHRGGPLPGRRPDGPPRGGRQAPQATEHRGPAGAPARLARVRVGDRRELEPAPRRAGPPECGPGRDAVRPRRRGADAGARLVLELPRGDLAVGQVVAGLLHAGRRRRARGRRGVAPTTRRGAAIGSATARRATSSPRTPSRSRRSRRRRRRRRRRHDRPLRRDRHRLRVRWRDRRLPPGRGRLSRARPRARAALAAGGVPAEARRPVALGRGPPGARATAGSTSGSSVTWRSPRERPSAAARTSTPTSASRRHPPPSSPAGRRRSPTTSWPRTTARSPRR